MNNNFITFEGVDGSGKTTAIEGLKKWLEANVDSSKYIFTREPGGSKTAEKIRDIILDRENDDIDSTTEAFLYAASRRQHLKTVVIPALEEGKIVFCDRFIDSSLAYQGVARGLGFEKVLRINEDAIDSLWPSLTIFFDIDPETAQNRISNAGGERSQKDRLEVEGMSFHKKVYEGYQKAIEKFRDRFHVVDAKKDKESVLGEIVNLLKPIISTK